MRHGIIIRRKSKMSYLFTKGKSLLLLAAVSILQFFNPSVLSLQAADYETVPGDPMQTRIYTLKNGLKVYLSVNKEKPRITAHVAVNTGSRNDPAETTGLAHYLEHLMFKGTHKFGTTNYEAEAPLLQKISDLYEQYRTLTDPQERKVKYHEIDSVSQLAAQYNIPNEYDKMMSMIGSQGTNAYTSYDVTCYVEDIPSNEIERWAMLQADRFQNMVMRGFHTELEAVYEEKNISMTKDSRKAIEALLGKLFPTHSYGTQSTIGTQEHLKNPSQVNIRNYYNKYYRPNNVAICMAGDLDPDQTIAILEKHFGSWQPGTDISPRLFPKQPAITAPQDTTVLGLETENIMLGWRLNGASSLQNDTIAMIDMLLSNGDVGLIDLDINQKMRCLWAGSGIWELKDYSIFIFQGTPNEGQTLDEVRSLLLGELDKIKRGDWDEKLIHSIVANEKLSELNALDNNRSRVSQMVDCYINGTPWKQQVERLDRMDRLTKASLMQWAKEHLTDGFVCVYKRKGDDTTIVTIDKPEITAIPSNRDLRSKFIEEYEKMEVEPIHPQFIDFSRDMQKGSTRKGLPILYKKNEQDERFTLQYRYEFGTDADRRYDVAEDYFELIGTSKQTLEQIKRRFYDIACSYSFSTDDKSMTLTLSGLQQHMPQAVKMLDEITATLKPDAEVYNQYIEQVQKGRMETRTNQNSCYNALVQYGLYGKQSPTLDVMSVNEMRQTDPSVFTNLIKDLSGLKHTVLYWGPATMQEVADIIDKSHKTARTLADVPQNKRRERVLTTNDEVLLAPYDAQNINMRMVYNENRPLDLTDTPLVSLFNEYFGGSMNAIVFQELREARGLAYNAWAAYTTPNHKEETEYYQQHIISQNDKLMDCIRVFREITDTLPESQVLFTTAQQSLMKTLAANRTTKTGVLGKYINAQHLGIDYDINRALYERIPQLSLTDLVNFEQQRIKGKPLRYLILGNEEDLDIPALEKIAPIKRLTLDDIFPSAE
ncbi:MAG: insulinase family protein [Prevotella sp.]|nr:insulinase family protein [Prevotella sp.]